MSSKSSRSRRKYFLLDSNQTVRKKPKRARNRFLNTLPNLLLLRQLGRFFRGSVLVTLACILMFGFIVFALLSPYFDLKKITVQRDSPHIEVASIDQALSDFYGQNLLFLDKDLAVERLLKTFPEFREVELTEQWPDGLSVQVTLSPPRFTLINNYDANFSVMSADGVILEEISDDDLALIKIEGYEQSLVSGTRFLDKAIIDKIILAQQIFTEELALTIEETRLLPLAQEVHLVTPKGTAYWIDLQLEIEPQLRKVELAADTIGVYTKPLEHVDLRIPNRVFWK